MNFTGRVTHIVSGDLWAGAEAFVYALATEQQRMRPDSVSCVVMNPGQLASALAGAGITTVVLDEGRSRFIDLLHQVRSHVESFGPHVLHAHREKENLLALLARGKHTLNGRTVTRITTVHGMPEPIHSRNLLRSGLKSALNKVALHVGFDAIVGVSRDIAATLRPRYPADRVLCIHNGVKIPACSPSARKKRSRQLRLLALGRLVPIKRFDRLRELSDELAKSPLSRPHMTLAGDGPLRGELQRRLLDGAPASYFEMPGFVPDASSLLQDADALVVTSDHEGIPMAVLESLALGIPVFGFNVGGLPEIAAPTLPLHLVPAANVQALANAIATYFMEHEPGTRVLPPTDWPFDIRCCALRYDALYDHLTSPAPI